MTEIQWLMPNLQNLHNHIIQQNQFCLWKSKETKEGKAPKIPFVIGDDGLPSYTFPKCRFMKFDELTDLLEGNREFGAGLYLKHGDLSVIDLDNYFQDERIGNILANLFRKGCYIEISPSRRGMHIFYSGSYDWTNGRKKSTCLVATDRDQKTTCEVYGPNDVRFITLTGASLFNPSFVKEADKLPQAEEIMSDLLDLQELFFPDTKKEVSTSSTLRKASPSFHLKDAQPINKTNKELEYIHGIIKKSPDYNQFTLFTKESKLNGHASISETDMAFAGYLTRYIPKTWSEDDKINVIIGFLKFYRPEREKYSKRVDYLISTATTALTNAAFFSEKKKNKPSNNLVQKKREISRSSILKICNIMRVFYFGRLDPTFPGDAIDKKDNSFEMICQGSLTTTDFKYFMQLLFQYREWYEQNIETVSDDDYCDINIKKIMRELGQSSGGKSFQLFLNSLKKLSAVHVTWTKRLYREKNDCCQVGGSLLSYKFFYKTKTSDLNSEIIGYKKLKIKMHSTIFNLLSKANYNYSLLNKESYHHLSSSKLQLLYFYFCQNTWPGKGYVTFTLTDLLTLWPKTKDSRVIARRKKDLTLLVQEFTAKSIDIADLSVEAIYSDQQLSKVKVKKHILTPV